jgi:hypothetical protein
MFECVLCQEQPTATASDCSSVRCLLWCGQCAAGTEGERFAYFRVVGGLMSDVSMCVMSGTADSNSFWLRYARSVPGVASVLLGQKVGMVSIRCSIAC